MPSPHAPTEHAKDLNRALESGTPPDTILRMARAYRSTGTWSPSASVNEAGHTLAQAWLCALLAYEPPDPPGKDDLAFLLDGQSLADLLARPLLGRHDGNLGAKLLQGMAGSKLSRKAEQFLWSKEMFRAFSQEDLEGFQGSRRSRESGDDIFRKALRGSKIDACRVLLDRGWSWTPRQGISPATEIASLEAWQLFLSTGGNPAMIVGFKDHDDNKVSMPLWKYLLSPHVGLAAIDVKEAARAWAKRHAQEGLEARDLEDYWRRLDRYGTLQDVLSRLRSRKDWPDLKNRAGENVLMVGLRNHLGVVGKLRAVARARPLFSQVDDAGWSLWHHLLLRGAKVPREDWRIAKAHAPPRPDPGLGLLCALASRGPLPQEALPLESELEGLKKGPGALGPEDWWAGSHEDKERLAAALAGIYWGSEDAGGRFSAAKLPVRLASLVRAFPPPPDLPASLAGMLAFNEMVNAAWTTDPQSMEMCDRFIAMGARISAEGEELAELEEVASFLPAQCQARFREIRLSCVLAPSSTNKPRSRF